MRHRIALVVGSVAASGILAVALVAAGLGPSTPALVSSVGTAPPAPRLQVDTVYIPAPAAPPTLTVQRVVTSSGEQEGSEAGGDN